MTVQVCATPISVGGPLSAEDPALSASPCTHHNTIYLKLTPPTVELNLATILEDNAQQAQVKKKKKHLTV